MFHYIKTVFSCQLKVSDLLTFTLYNAKILNKYMLIAKRRVEMDKIKILHTADMHLGSTFSNLPYDKSKIRQNEVVSGCINVVKSASDCDVLLLSGDIFDSGNVSLRLADAFLDAVKEISKTQVFYSCGNHDNYHTDIVSYCIKNAPPNLHIFLPDTPSVFTLEEKKTKIYGVSFSNEHSYESYTEKISECDVEYINILCVHGDIDSDIYNSVDIKSLANKGFDYIALGHIHSHNGINKIKNTYWSYPGIPEGRGFDECGKKGYIKGYISKNLSELNFISSSKRIYVDEIIDVSDFKNEYEIYDVVNSISDGKENICKFTFVGENEFSSFDFNLIPSVCDMFYALCVDNTVSKINVDAYLGYEGIMGMCAKETVKLCKTCETEEEKEKYKKAFKLLAALYENR